MVHDEQVPGLVSVAVLAATALLGPEFAVAVGAYGAIVLGWFGGMLVGLWRMPPVPRLQLAGFVVVSLVLTLGVTVSVAELLTAPDSTGGSIKVTAAPWSRNARASSDPASPPPTITTPAGGVCIRSAG